MTHWSPLEIIAEQEADKARITALLAASGVVRSAPAEYVGRHRAPRAVEFRGVDADGLAVYYGPAVGW